MPDNWMVVSKKEMEFANLFLSKFSESSNSIELYIDEMNMLVDEVQNNYGFRFDNIFAQNNDQISGNVLTQIAYKISEQLQLNDDNGVVLTSNVLAEDMVKVAMIEWLAANSEYEEYELYNFVYGREAMPEKLKEQCESIRWYDPCVGGGVYPLSIASVYKSLGIVEKPQIYGYDVNPLYVETTILRLSLVYGKENAAFYRGNIKCKDALDTFLTQKSIFDETEEEYDIVIGNPPYVRGGAIPISLRKKYVQNYPELGGKSTDLYTYFMCHGVNAMAEKGVLCYVTPAQFQISNYGKPIRKFLSSKMDLCLIADFNELPVFKDISVHTSVYCMIKERKNTTFKRYEYTELPTINPLEKLFDEGSVFPQENISENGWIFSSDKAMLLLNHLDAKGITLREYSGGVYSGIKSSCKSAFFMRKEDTIGFTEVDWKYCVKMIIPKKISAWKSEWSDDYFALVKKNDVLPDDSKIYKHMLKYENDLKKRTDIDGHKTWYGLRPCAYYDVFKEPKIIYPDISTTCKFSMDLQGYYIPDGAFFIPGEDYYLLGLLNSCVGDYYFHQRCARIGNPQKGGRIRFKKVYVENFPVPHENTNKKVAEEIKEVAHQIYENGDVSEELQKKLDDLAILMYDIPQSLIRLITE